MNLASDYLFAQENRGGADAADLATAKARLADARYHFFQWDLATCGQKTLLCPLYHPTATYARERVKSAWKCGIMERILA